MICTYSGCFTTWRSSSFSNYFGLEYHTLTELHLCVLRLPGDLKDPLHSQCRHPCPSATLGLSTEGSLKVATDTHNLISTRFSCRSALQETPIAQGAETGPSTIGQGDSGDGNGDGDGGGLSWLTQAAGSPAPSTRHKSPQSTVASKKSNATPTGGGGGWMSSGKFGLPIEDDSDRDGDGGPKKPKKGKQAGGAVSAASGPGGWLGSGALGAPTGEESDEDDDGGGDGGRAVMVTTETQTEDDIEEVTKNGGARKLPPWAKPWTPPPKPEVVPDAAPEVPPEKEVNAPI